MTVLYLDTDDEITDAVARIRTAEDRHMVLVLPPGSRIATSRINFRLLAREAAERDVILAVVSGEPGVRALALSAGLPAHGNVTESEQALKSIGHAPAEAPIAPWIPFVDAAAGGAPAATPSGVATFQPSPPRATGDPGAVPPGAGAQPTAAPGAHAQPTAAPGHLSDAAAPPSGTDVTPSGSGADLGSTVRPDPPAGAATSAGPGAAVPGAETRVMPTVAPRGRRGTEPAVEPSRGYGVTPRAATSGVPGGDAPPATEWFDPDEEARTRQRAGGRRRGRRWLGTLVRLAVVAGLLGGAAYAAYLYLPSATIVLHPRTETAGPINIRITADPRVAVPDSAAGLIPAERVEIPISATADFPATGSEVTQTRATGTVRFTSENTLFDVPIPEGTRLSTAGGLEFETVQSVVVPKASFESGPTTVDAAVRAVRGGPSGNVGADTIRRVPEAVSAALVAVTNPMAMSGGSRTEVAVVTRRDYDRALGELTARLSAQLAAALADPATTPRGLVLFPATADLGRVTPDQALGELVDLRVERFALSAESIATVLAVNEALLAEAAGERLMAEVPDAYQLFTETVVTTSSRGRVERDVIVYDVTAQGERYRAPDMAAIVESVRGRNISEARAILEQYGSVEITPWPEFVDRMPDQAGRISLLIVDPERRNP